MTPAEYQKCIARTCKVVGQREILLLAALGLTEELAGIVPHLQELCFGRDMSAETRIMNQLIRKAGDFLHYLALAHQALEIELDGSLDRAIAAWVERNIGPTSFVPRQDPYGSLVDLLEAVGHLAGQVNEWQFQGKKPAHEKLVSRVRDVWHRYAYFAYLINLDVFWVMEKNVKIFLQLHEEDLLKLGEEVSV